MSLPLSEIWLSNTEAATLLHVRGPFFGCNFKGVRYVRCRSNLFVALSIHSAIWHRQLAIWQLATWQQNATWIMVSQLRTQLEQFSIFLLPDFSQWHNVIVRIVVRRSTWNNDFTHDLCSQLGTFVTGNVRSAAHVPTGRNSYLLTIPGTYLRCTQYYVASQCRYYRFNF